MAAPVKLPLIARKNIRDEYTAKIGGLQTELKEYTGEDYEFSVNFDVLYPTLKQDERYQVESPGTIAFNTYEGVVYKIKTMTKEGEDEAAKEFLNNVVSKKQINILVTDEASSYSSCRVKDGVLEILYKEGGYGTNAGYAADNLEKELDKAFAETNKGALPLAAKKGFRDDFVEKKADLEKKIAEELLGNTITLVADPDAIWKLANEEYDKLKRSEKSSIDLDGIARNMGSAIYAYFEGFLGVLQYKFKQDDMMVEAFMESCPKKEVHVKLVPKGELSRTYNDCKFEDDVFVIRTIPQYWYTNVSDAADEVEKLL
ncbi:hypothetical protein TWF696_004684 [Orbilia brochopaga]|uniref:Uncharacterized protein n=1 Tax=Orbilia brochopaga TaxID=3140254 RepID=A0AAV9V9U1_9PEZI